ncbi:hypothetical protein B0H17DRAFT_1213471 [Mycena rosella]|uniref:Uncharacterized protein n=1 Tax=Mycena rosella TaxID=1033263 RepID=A0AAD7G542_MYCRO|nr:hypothetical protein B0H17DRAFT_1213471 [Mycena rosella]
MATPPCYSVWGRTVRRQALLTVAVMIPACRRLLNYIDAHTDAFIARLAEAAAIPSIPGNPAFRPSVLQMPEWLNTQLQATLPRPNAILGRIGACPGKNIVPLYAVYGHFDIQPGARLGWDLGGRQLF